MNIENLGRLNGHSTGIILKELVRRAIKAIQAERIAFEVTKKRGYTGKMDDMLTSADKKAQEVYLKSIRECFPDFGIVAEEDGVNTFSEGKPYITIDPLDGTKAFVRRQSHGVGTMIALVTHGEVISAYVGDVNTNEIFGFRPESKKVHRISGFDVFETLGRQKKIPLSKQYVMLRDRPSVYLSSLILPTIDKFKNFTVDGGSIGTWLARLWKGEAGAVLLTPGTETPWDSSPTIGISLKLGFVFLKPRLDEKGWEQYAPALSPRMYKRDHDVLIVHRSNLTEFSEI